MAYLATRGSGFVNGVSRLHGEVSRAIFAPLFPRWPQREVPVGHVTNAIHLPSWASPPALALWSEPDAVTEPETLKPISDQELFDFRASARRRLVNYVRGRLARQVQASGNLAIEAEWTKNVLDPDTLTLGFARRFAEYKRPTLLLHDLERLTRLLHGTERPVQLIVAGKAHPGDEGGKRMVQAMASLAARPDLRDRLVFLADYDIALTQQLVAGVDVWLNTPRRPMEASGTSGMKVLAGGGLNVSELDGWWPEAYTPEVGWALGDGQEHNAPDWDAREAEQLYALLEQEIVAAFYDRPQAGVPSAWLKRVRESMTRLTPQFRSDRMMREYVSQYYLPAAIAARSREAEGGQLAAALEDWHQRLQANWPSVSLSDLQVSEQGDQWQIAVTLSLGALEPSDVRVELYADAVDGKELIQAEMTRLEPETKGDRHRYQAQVPAIRPASDYTPRVIAAHPEAFIPLEDFHIVWLH